MIQILPTSAYRPNNRSISQPSSPLAASGRTEARVGAGRAATVAGGCGELAAATLVCGVACARFENKPPACEAGKAATGTP